MNGEVVCQSRSVTVLSCPKPPPPPTAHDDKPAVRPAQDGRRSPMSSPQGDAPRAGEGRTPNAALTAPRDERPSPPRLPACLPAPPELPLPLGNTPLHNNQNGPQRRTRVVGKKPARRTAAAKNSQNRKVTDFYPIRRSSRKSKTELRCEQKKRLDDLITTGLEEGMEVQHIEGKGRAVFATRCFQKGDFVVEYHGDLLQINDAKKREAEYAQNPATGCYMYYFQYLCKTYCVDATRESGRMGRLINHSKAGNCQTKLHDINGVPHLILVASRDIDRGEELLYDYGDRSKASIAAHPWLKH
ncbi:N-lysine methyltransferase KMT5A-A [Salarias fasciatus]|uniref:N-lysine methyltransferase KMT5A-A n=1 Tax=Salarias fasciatus TaxID=181472 RepID=UPI00117709A6|nr:N-lysine methyltransferase KMT5A [Salarias fasciatus]